MAKSLVLAETAHGPRSRYRLLETIKAYAGDRLEESGEAARVREAHARAYLTLAEQAEPELTGSAQECWFPRLEADHANLRSALEWSIAHGHADWALRLAGALIQFWRVRCHFTEGRELIEATIRSGAGQSPALRAKARWGEGYLRLMADDHEGAVPALEESLAAFEELDDMAGCARALLMLGNSGGRRGDPGALGQLERSVALAREAGDLWCLAHALRVAGLVHRDSGDMLAAYREFHECLAAAGEARDTHSRAYGLRGLGEVALLLGRYDQAASVLEEALAIARELGDEYIAAHVQQYLGDLARRQGDFSRARTLLADSLHRHPEPAARVDAILSLMLLAEVAHAEGDLAEARQLLEEVAARRLPWGTPVYALFGLGQLAAEEGDLGKARPLLEDVLESCRARGRDRSRLTGLALHELGLLARSTGHMSRAASLHNEALTLQQQSGEAPAVVASLEAIGGLNAATGRCERATRLLGAAAAMRERSGYAPTSAETARYEADLSLAEQGLPAKAFQAALSHGAGLTIEEAVVLASRGRQRRVRPTSGWPSLTETEKQVATLVAEGLTNQQIAERMFIGFETVKTHLRRIFPKLGVTKRRELEPEVERHRQPQ